MAHPFQGFQHTAGREMAIIVGVDARGGGDKCTGAWVGRPAAGDFFEWQYVS